MLNIETSNHNKHLEMSKLSYYSQHLLETTKNELFYKTETKYIKYVTKPNSNFKSFNVDL